MGLLPSNQKDQIKVAMGLIGVALAGYYYSYPYTAKAAELETVRAHVETLDGQNAKARARRRRTPT
ncbi:hypothetical protein J421_3979 [Gemmatirosa kalamazoonensis]|uniref:Uncharacterized protein n=1 Tax=Gemmatirosa kalamazoonensis TaxID=861299 RepID=W0RL67_9BACT|nr:hypothetical protein [Gemmatirosa kalamazoonensis]AHG91516.1 hypothetical protein J421_3979 [Gemmatirosa kalamazoonensis]